MRLLAIICLSICLASCNNNQEVIKNISGLNGKYWDIKWEGKVDEAIPDLDSSLTYCYYFGTDGTYLIYTYRDNKRVPYENGDIEIPKVWAYKSADSVMIATAMYKIEELTEDTFTYSSPRFGKTVLAKSKNQK